MAPNLDTMAPYSDNPISNGDALPSSNNSEEGYRVDFPIDPDALHVTDLFDTNHDDNNVTALPARAVQVPPATATSYLFQTNPSPTSSLNSGTYKTPEFGNDTRPGSNSMQKQHHAPYSDNPTTNPNNGNTGGYSDDPYNNRNRNSSGLYRDEEQNDMEDSNGVFKEGSGPWITHLDSNNSNNNHSNSDKHYHRRTISMCLLGFFLGTIVMIGFVLITGDRINGGGGDVSSSNRLGSPNSGNGLDLDLGDTDANPVVKEGNGNENGSEHNEDTKNDKTTQEAQEGGNENDESNKDNTAQDAPNDGGKSDSGEKAAEEGVAAAGESKDEDAAEADVTVKVQEPSNESAKEDQSSPADPAPAPEPVKEDASKPEEPVKEPVKEEAAPVPAPAKEVNAQEPPAPVDTAPAQPVKEEPAKEENKPAVAAPAPAKEDNASQPAPAVTAPVQPAKEEAKPAPVPASAKVENAPPQPVPAVAKAPPAPAPAPKSNIVPMTGNPDKQVDLSIPYCGSCRYKNTAYSCEDRVAHVVDHYHLGFDESRQYLKERGHCPETRVVGYEPAENNEQVVSGLGWNDCRKRPEGGEKAWCGHCQWKASRWSCITRVGFLKRSYGTPEHVAMQTLMDQGHCMDERSEEERKRDIENGTDLWCDACSFKNNALCLERMKMSVDMKNETAVVESKLAFMAKGYCIMPPYCDTLSTPEADSP